MGEVLGEGGGGRARRPGPWPRLFMRLFVPCRPWPRSCRSGRTVRSCDINERGGLESRASALALSHGKFADPQGWGPTAGRGGAWEEPAETLLIMSVAPIQSPSP